MRDTIRLGIFLLIAIGLIKFVDTYYGLTVVVGTSMEPTYKDNDLVVLDKTKEPEVGDIILIYSEQMNKILCKRLIGLGGNHIVLTKDGITNGGVLLPEYFKDEKEWCAAVYNIMPIDVNVPLVSVYVLGDNRVDSADSRHFGCFEKSNIVGVCIYNISRTVGLSFNEMKAFMMTIWILFLFFPIYNLLSDGIIMRKYKSGVIKNV